MKPVTLVVGFILIISIVYSLYLGIKMQVKYRVIVIV